MPCDCGFASKAEAEAKIEREKIASNQQAVEQRSQNAQFPNLGYVRARIKKLKNSGKEAAAVTVCAAVARADPSGHPAPADFDRFLAKCAARYFRAISLAGHFQSALRYMLYQVYSAARTL
ncbi:MAG TPA: hypothetical protein VGJ20_42395 [Xanthobacteraceae bacterium]|jgi:hypothetical protein